jgi:alpha-L-fucosidase
MIYLETKPGPTYEPYIVRSKDLIHWESSLRNPVIRHSWEDKLIANPKLTPDQRAQVEKAVNINDSDLDLCEFQGRTVITYSWGNQQGTEFLAEAVYDGKLAGFVTDFFPK